MRYSPLIIVILFLFSCGEYNEVLKSNDPEYKYAKALEYYEAGDCYKALPIFEELIGVVRGTQRAEQVYYYYAKVHYCIGDYFMANYYFKNFAKTYEQSEFAEECAFLAALCNYKNSPKSSLDQTESYAALDELQLFMNRYPNSSLMDSCNVLMNKINFKLEEKAFKIAALYVKTEKYKAASLALKQMIKDYPASTFTEKAMFLLVKSNFLLSERSINSKKLERYEDCTKSYYNFVGRFPDSKLQKEAESYFNRSLKEMEKLDIANN